MATIVLRDALLRATQTLPPRQRAVLVLRYLDDLPVEHIAEILGSRDPWVTSGHERAFGPGCQATDNR